MVLACQVPPTPTGPSASSLGILTGLLIYLVHPEPSGHALEHIGRTMKLLRVVGTAVATGLLAMALVPQAATAAPSVSPAAATVQASPVYVIQNTGTFAIPGVTTGTITGGSITNTAGKIDLLTSFGPMALNVTNAMIIETNFSGTVSSPVGSGPASLPGTNWVYGGSISLGSYTANIVGLTVTPPAPSPQPQTIAFNSLADTPIDNPPPALTATATSGLPVVFTSDTTPVCTVVPEGVVLVALGTCTINANQPGNELWAPAPQVQHHFQVLPQPDPEDQTIDFNQPADTPLPDGPVALIATATSGLAVVFTSDTTSICTVTGSSVALVALGTCTINANQPGQADPPVWRPAPQVQHSFQVVKSPQTITFDAISDLPITDGFVTLAAQATSDLDVTFTSGTTSVCIIEVDDQAVLLGTGTCTVTASQPGDDTFAAAPQVSRSFQVTANPYAYIIQHTGTLSIPAYGISGDIMEGGFTDGSGKMNINLPGMGELSLVATDVVATATSFSGTLTTPFGSGTATIAGASWVYSGTIDLAGVSAVITGLTVVPPPVAQTITFPALADTLVSAGPVALSATASSGLTVAYTSNTTGVCTVAGTSVSLVAAGTCTVTASQPGQTSVQPVVLPAASVSRTFQVTGGALLPATVPRGTILGAGKKIKRSGLTKLTSAHPRTTDGTPLRTTVVKRGRGDLVLYKVIRKANGTVKIRTYGYRLTLRITWSAPATGTYAAYKQTRTYRI